MLGTSKILEDDNIWYLNQTCQGTFFGKEKLKGLGTCEQCGGVNLCLFEGTLRDYVIDEIYKTIWFKLSDYHDENKYGLQKENYDWVTDKYTLKQILGVLKEDEEFKYYVDVDIFIEGDCYTITYKDVDDNLLLDALKKALTELN